MSHLTIRLLGPMQVYLDEVLVTNFATNKVRALLAFLAVEAHKPHRRTILASLLWPEQPESAARTNLRRALSNLRQAIGDHLADPPFLLISRQTIQFNQESDYWLDVKTFQEGVEGDIHNLQEAVDLYRGAFLEGFAIGDSAAFEEWSLLKRERLNRVMAAALRRLAFLYEQGGDYEEALTHAWRLIEMEPWQEDAHRCLMRLLTLSGQRSAALAQYETMRRVLAEDLDVAPEAESTQLNEQIRSGEMPSLPAVLPEKLARMFRQVGECPYRGLAAFREEDAPFFFGREIFTKNMLESIKQQPAVAVIVGSSGSGKSSVVFAGLLPRLREEGTWLIVHFRPGAMPFYALSSALLNLLEPLLSEADRLIETRKLAETLRTDVDSLYNAVIRLLKKNQKTSRVLFIVDQFEELYTLCPEPETQWNFLDRLLVAVETGERWHTPPFVLLFTLRADFMGHALAHRPFADVLQNVSLMMGPMNRNELRQAIEKPAEVQAAAFEAGLIDRLLDDVGEQSGNLPLLEFALTLLWEQHKEGWLTHAGYEEIGRVEGALARYADDVYEKLNAGEQGQAQRLFVQLVRPGEGTEDTRRTASRAELGDENWALVQYLADKRLVVTGQNVAGQETVEVVHEALIQRWWRLRAWMDAVRAFRTWQEGLRAAVRGWEVSGHDEGALLRGAPLMQAESWLSGHGNELSETENTFIQASIELRERNQTEREQRRRRTTIALAGGLVVTLLLAVFAFSTRTLAQREADVNHSLVLAANAEQAFENGEGDLALALALEAVNMDQPPPEGQRALSDIALGPGTRSILEGHSNAVKAAAISPDALLALSGSCSELNSDDCIKGEMILWDLESGTELRRFKGHSNWVNDVAFALDGKTALSGSGDGLLILWDVGTGEILRRYEGHTGGINSVFFSPDSNSALSGSDDGSLIMWDVTAGDVIQRFEGHTGAVNAVAFSPDGQTILSGSDDMTMILWDVLTGEIIHHFEGHENSVTDIAFHPDGNTILSVGDDLSLRSWNLETGEQDNYYSYNAHLHSLAVTPDGHTALFNVQHDLHLWDVGRWQGISRLAGHETGPESDYVINDIVIISDGRLALSASDDGSLRLWNLEGQMTYRRFETEGMPISAVAVSPDGHNLLTGSTTGDAVLWDVESGEVIRRLKGEGIPICPDCVAFSPDGSQALVASEDVFGDSGATSLVLWDVETGQEIQRFEGHVTYIRSLAFNPDGQAILSGSQSIPDSSLGDLIFWELETGREIRRFDITHDVANIAMSADGSRALTGSATDFVAILWDVASGQEISRFVGHSGPVLNVAFGPQEKTILSASYDGSLIQWDIETGQILHHYLGHDQPVWGLEVSSSSLEDIDEGYVISSSESGEVILWDFETGEEIRRLKVHTGWVVDVAFSPDSQKAYSVGFDGALIEWQIAEVSLNELEDWIHTNRYVRDLTCEERAQYRVEPLCRE